MKLHKVQNIGAAKVTKAKSSNSSENERANVVILQIILFVIIIIEVFIFRPMMQVAIPAIMVTLIPIFLFAQQFEEGGDLPRSLMWISSAWYLGVFVSILVIR